MPEKLFKRQIINLDFFVEWKTLFPRVQKTRMKTTWRRPAKQTSPVFFLQSSPLYINWG